METFYIRNFDIKQTVTEVYKTDTYVIKKSNRFIRWVVRLLEKYKIITQYAEPNITYNRIAIQPEKVFDLVYKQIEIMHYNGKTPTRVILGYDAMQKLHIECYQEMKFNMPFNYHIDGKRQILGLDIELKPHIDGVLVL